MYGKYCIWGSLLDGEIHLMRACAAGIVDVVTFATSTAGVHLVCEALPLAQESLINTPDPFNVRVSRLLCYPISVSGESQTVAAQALTSGTSKSESVSPKYTTCNIHAAGRAVLVEAGLESFCLHEPALTELL